MTNAEPNFRQLKNCPRVHVMTDEGSIESHDKLWPGDFVLAPSVYIYGDDGLPYFDLYQGIIGHAL